jgi:hypothetical protein
MGVDWEVIVSIGIMILVAIAIWRGGGKNPVGTGQLQRQLNTIGAKVGQIEAALKETCSKNDLAEIRGELSEIEARTASSREVLAIEAQISGLRAEITAAVKAADRTEASVQRIEGYFLQRGIDGR